MKIPWEKSRVFNTPGLLLSNQGSCATTAPEMWMLGNWERCFFLHPLEKSHG